MGLHYNNVKTRVVKQTMRKCAMMLCMIALVVTGWGCGVTENYDEESSIIKVGDELPPFSVIDTKGQVHSNASLKGAVSVVVFFYTPCGDCQRALPVLNSVYLRHIDDAAIKWIAIGRDESLATVSHYWETHNLSLPCSPQPDRAVYSLFATQRIPRVYISDAQGVVRAMYDDSQPIDASRLEQTLLSLMP